VQTERARALLEETIARRGRALAELSKLDAGPYPRKPKPTSQPGTRPSPAGSTARDQTYGAQ
jgi:hypothetical protein